MASERTQGDAEDDLEWEEWDPHSISFGHHMIAGSFAGLVEHVSIFPIDTLKTHMQCERCISGNSKPLHIFTCASNLIQERGILRLWRGVSATFAGCIPAHAAYFSIFESMKVLTGADQAGYRPISAAFCGASAALGHDMFMTPFDTIKQRMQLGYYKSLSHCLTSTIRAQGVTSLYLSLPTTLLMNLPYGCIMVAVNESMRKLLTSSSSSSLMRAGPRLEVSLAAGCTAGATAALLTTPLDVIKTRLQLQDLQPAACPSKILKSLGSAASSPVINSSSSIKMPLLRYRTALQVVRKVWMEEGIAGFYRGASLRMLVHAPSVAISWAAYDSAKKLLIASTGNSSLQ